MNYLFIQYFFISYIVDEQTEKFFDMAFEKRT